MHSKKLIPIVLLLMLPIMFTRLLTFGQAEDSINVEDEFNVFRDSLEKAGGGIVNDSAFNKKYMKYNEFVLDHRIRVFNWQYSSSIYIFWIVMTIVASGLTLSAIQFFVGIQNGRRAARLANKSKKRPAGETEQLAEPNNDTEIKLSLTELSIKSSVIGLIILVISIAFFYLYLQVVYPISIVAE